MNVNTYGNYYTPYSQPQPIKYPEPQPTMGLKGRPVSSIEEAKASIIDFDGSVFFFPDLANRRIYTKQINTDGTALLKMYELKEVPTTTVNFNPNNYITREEFETAIKSLQSANTPQIKKEEEIVKVPEGSFSF